MRWLGCFRAPQKKNEQTASGNDQNAADQNQCRRHEEFHSQKFCRISKKGIVASCPECLDRLQEEVPLPAFAPRTAAAETIRFRTGFIDGKRPAFNVLTVEGGNRFVGFSIVTHVNEPKPSGLSRIGVSHNADALNCSVRFKKRIENRFRDGNTQVSNKYAFHMLQVFPVVVNGSSEARCKTSVERRSYAAAVAAVSVTFRDIVGTQYWRCQCSQAELRTRVTSVRSRGFASTS